jgi:hypothetical protein
MWSYTSETLPLVDLYGEGPKFVQGYGVLAKPLTNLLQNKAFLWTEQAQKAFTRLKQAMSQTPVLTLPDFSLPL